MEPIITPAIDQPWEMKICLPGERKLSIWVPSGGEARLQFPKLGSLVGERIVHLDPPASPGSSAEDSGMEPGEIPVTPPEPERGVRLALPALPAPIALPEPPAAEMSPEKTMETVDEPEVSLAEPVSPGELPEPPSQAPGVIAGRRDESTEVQVGSPPSSRAVSPTPTAPPLEDDAIPPQGMTPYLRGLAAGRFQMTTADSWKVDRSLNAMHFKLHSKLTKSFGPKWQGVRYRNKSLSAADRRQWRLNLLNQVKQGPLLFDLLELLRYVSWRLEGGVTHAAGKLYLEGLETGLWSCALFKFIPKRGPLCNKEIPLALELPLNYPSNPPSLRVEDKLYHPIIFSHTGEMALNVLDNWHEMRGLIDVLKEGLAALSFPDYGNIKNPLFVRRHQDHLSPHHRALYYRDVANTADGKRIQGRAYRGKVTLPMELALLTRIVTGGGAMRDELLGDTADTTAASRSPVGGFPCMCVRCTARRDSRQRSRSKDRRESQMARERSRD